MRWYLIPLYFFDEYLLILRHQIKQLRTSLPPSKWDIGSKGEILCIQGIHETWIPMKKIAQALHQQGYRIHFIHALENNTLPVKIGYKLVADYIINHSLQNLIIVSHSKGGLISLHLLQDPVIAKKIKKLITIACPYRGSLFAIAYRSAREFLPYSQLIKEASLNIDCKKIVNIYPKVDNHVVPNRNLRLKDAHNKQINIFGHTRILESQQTIDYIVNAVKS